jgi:hypothetical protein
MATATPRAAHEAERQAIRTTMEALRRRAEGLPPSRGTHLHRAAEKLEEAHTLLGEGCGCPPQA